MLLSIQQITKTGSQTVSLPGEPTVRIELTASCLRNSKTSVGRCRIVWYPSGSALFFPNQCGWLWHRVVLFGGQLGGHAKSS